MLTNAGLENSENIINGGIFNEVIFKISLFAGLNDGITVTDVVNFDLLSTYKIGLYYEHPGKIIFNPYTYPWAKCKDIKIIF